MNLKEIMEDISTEENIEILVMTDSNGFHLESAGTTDYNNDEISIYGKSITSTLNEFIGSISDKGKTVQGLIEYNTKYILITMFPEDLFLITISNKDISPQNLWNIIASRYKELAYALLG